MKQFIILFSFLFFSISLSQNGCTLSDGSFVESGWFGNDTGANWCNVCFCENGVLGCTEMECETQDECTSDIDQDGICEDDCGDMPTIIVDCECGVSNPYTQTVFFTTVNEENCIIIDDCACSCINDINENGICDEEEEGCWDDGEFYDVYTQLFVDECNYYECVVSSGFFWSELMTIDGCGEDDCPCINPDWIDPMAFCPTIYQPVIGCDGEIYSNSCIAQAAGVTSWIDEMSGEETVLEWDCNSSECVAQLDPECMYMTVIDPVCGCDGVTYSNSGEAACNNIFEYTNGACEELLECSESESLLTLNWSGAIAGETTFTVTSQSNGIIYSTILNTNEGSLEQCWETDLQSDCFLIDIDGPDGLEWNLFTPLSNVNPALSGNDEDFLFGSECSEGCTENGLFYEIQSQLYINECQYTYCEDINTWSNPITIDECNGCVLGDEFYCVGCELYISDCEYITCEGNQTWSEPVTSDCNQTEGCTDETACNYMEYATLDNDSCVYEGDPECEDCGTVLDFNNYGDNEFFSETYYAPPGVIITINFSGSTESCCDHIYVNGVEYDGVLDGVVIGDEVLNIEWTTDGSVNSNSGYGWSAELICTEPITGCTQPYAENYNPDANTDDGSCELDCTYLLTYDSYVELNYDNSISNYYCNYYVSNGTYTIEQAISYGYNCDCVVIGCTDPDALNYDEAAFVDDCSCIYASNCSSISVTGGSYPTEVSWNIEDTNGNIVLSGNAPECQNYCFEDGCYTINMIDSYGDGWNNAVLSIDEYDYTFTTGYNSIAPFGYNTEGCIIEGCTNVLADNYNEEANYDDGSCEYGCEYLLSYESYQELGFDNSVSNYYCGYYLELGYYTIDEMINMGYNCDCVIVGCTDEEANNYDEEAFIDDCTCTYDNECPSISFNSTDSNLGWEITNIEGEVILEYNTNGQEIGSYCGNYCFEEGCYIINMTSTWGGGWFGTTLDIGNESFTLLNGSEGMESFAYNTDMNCEIGCTDSEASNYNPNAILDDGSCVLFGCTITAACNYNPDATAFDGSCYYCFMDDCNTYPSETYDCDGNCIDNDQDGICDEDEVYGCLDSEACNYNQLATENDESCEYPEDYYDCNGNCISDMDNDLVCDELDNCPEHYNPNQEDFNSDNTGDACDGIGLNDKDSFEWNIYPNPLKEFTIIDFKNPSNKEFKIEILSLSGKSIYKKYTFNSQHYITNKFASGYYIIELESNNNIVRKTLIVE